MTPGDRVLVYHTGEQREIVAFAEVASKPGSMPFLVEFPNGSRSYATLVFALRTASFGCAVVSFSAARSFGRCS
jgi:hypothetical protein